MMVTIGRIVHYVLQGGEHRPAIVVRVWAEDYCNLLVFTDVQNDGLDSVEWETSVNYSDKHEAGTWHWPERDE